ncbi:MAG TPA: hypothetical protein VK886_00060 [Vicinamibacterales bacterium]|nr:hypothetical protein [Vicinamibacterales bacterium]
MSGMAAAGRAAREAALRPGLRLQKIDRFVLPAGDSRRAAFIVDRLYVAHSLRERLAWSWHRANGGRALAHAAESGELTAASLSAIATAEAWPALPQAARSWIVDTDYHGSARDRSIVFVFGDDRSEPSLVVKRARAASGRALRSLARERDALEALRRALPADLADTVPCVAGYEAADGWESLALTWLPGRSAYVEMQTRLLPSASVEGHFLSAASWLARFHEATSVPGRSVEPASDANDAASGEGATPDWLARLRDACARAPVRAVRSHGDFWARNVLLARRRGLARIMGVVDWEQSCDASSPFDDLFQFALTYGLSYPWSRYRRAEPIEAFRRTFLADTRVARAVRAYLQAYCRERGLDAALLASWFRCFLRERASRDDSKGDLWTRFDQAIGAAGRSVFSG